MEEVTCVTCGEVFLRLDGRGRRKYCSQECSPNPHRSEGPCAVDGCDKPGRVTRRGLCFAHYMRWQRHGDVNAVNRRGPKHGTLYGYRRMRCRCDECRAANAARMREYAAQRRAQGRPLPSGSLRDERVRRAFVAPVNRTAIFERDGWRCQICGKATDRRKRFPHPKSPVLDHIIPLAAGGTHEPANVQCAHARCNGIKGHRAANDQLRLIG